MGSVSLLIAGQVSKNPLNCPFLFVWKRSHDNALFAEM